MAKREIESVKAVTNYPLFHEMRLKLNKTQADNNHALIGQKRTHSEMSKKMSTKDLKEAIQERQNEADKRMNKIR